MNIEKAIEILAQWDKGTDPLYLPDLPDAVKLSIEALKQVRDFRLTINGEPIYRLPEETKD